MTDERTPTDFALEFAEYMAKGAEAFIAAVCKQQRLQQQFEEGEGPDPLTMQDADEGVSEYMRGFTADIYEFRKRRDRAALSAPAVPEGYKLVPIEPTPEMMDAAVQAICYGPESGFTRIAGPYRAWRVMLAAAPSPQEPQK